MDAETEDDEDMGHNDYGSGNGPAAEHPWGGDGPAWLEDAGQMAARARAWAVSNPFAAIGIALAAGFMVGRIARRVG